MKNMKPNVNCLKYVFILVTSILIVSTIIGGSDQYDSKDVCNINKIELRGENCRQEDHIK